MKSWLVLGAVTAAAVTARLETRLNWLLNEPLTGIPRFETTDPPSLSSAKLGRLLFYDKRLSVDGTVSCASCHEVAHGYSNQLPLAVGIHGAVGTRKVPAILNKAFLSPQFWDGRVATLEEQVEGPLFNPIEMGNTPENLIKTLDGIAGYRIYFQEAFGDGDITLARVARAIADFERTLLSGDSKFDRFEKDPVSFPLTPDEEAGYMLFLDRDCEDCHSIPFFTDNQFHNTGIGFQNGVFKDEGRAKITKVADDIGAFKTPTLRNVESHAPYMHDGSLATLEAVIEFYNKGGTKNPHLDRKMIPLGLLPEQKKQLLAFLKTLQGRGFEETPPGLGEFPM